MSKAVNRKPKRRTLSVVSVIWVDSASGEPGWQDPSSFQEAFAAPCNRIYSAGILVYDCSEHVVIALSVGAGAVADCMKIPRCSIEKLTVICDSGVDPDVAGYARRG